MIPGPGESLTQFQKRQSVLAAALEKLKNTYPDRSIQIMEGIPVVIEKKRLKPWEAGALWIYEDEEGIRLPLIQLKKWNQETFDHEKIHAKRIAFDESRYEELFAYQTSKKKWRRIWGALFRSQIEVWVFLVLSLLPIVNIYLTALPMGFILIQAMRLGVDRKKMLNAITKLGSYEKALFLTDHEINLFSKISIKEILIYLQSHAREDLRICKLMQLMS